MITKIKELILKLNQYRNSYYNENKSIISDTEYDKLFDELQQLETSSGVIFSNSPTQSVGYEVKSKLTKVQHSIPLLSLNKTKQINDVQKFISKNPSLFMLKYDALTIEIIYENGELTQGSTRGDGNIGEDVTHNVKVMKNVPLKIQYTGHLKIVGEAIIHKNDFDRINSVLSEEEKYKNPRNLASGSVRQLDSEVCENRNIYFYPWDVLEGLDDILSEYGANSRNDKLSEIVSYGFENPERYMVDNRMNLSEIESIVDTLKEYAEKHNIPIDGLVVKYDDIKYSKSLGGTSHHNNDGLALKFSEDEETTTLRDVEFSIGRSGVLTPVAVFDSVEIDGTEVSRASLHNLSIIENLELGLLDEILIIKANQIIPQVKNNLTRSNTLKIPTKCPFSSNFLLS